MLEKAPSIRNSIMIGFILALACYLAEVRSDDLGILGYYLIFIFGILEAISISVYVFQSYHYAKAWTEYSRPDVRISQSHAEITRSISHMNAEQRYHHIQIVNALQLPLRINPGETLVTLEGMEVSYESLKRYLEGMKAEQHTSEGEPVYQMSSERDASPQDREAHRQIADEIGRSYSVSAPHGNKPVRTTKTKLSQYLEALVAVNE